jgi:hypothetical protein
MLCNWEIGCFRRILQFYAIRENALQMQNR